MKPFYYVTVVFADDELSVLSRTFSSEWKAKRYMKANWSDLQYFVTKG